MNNKQVKNTENWLTKIKNQFYSQEKISYNPTLKNTFKK